MKLILSNEQWLFLANRIYSVLIHWIRPSPNIENTKTILCIKWDEIGDMATSLHVFKLLKLNFPNAEISVIAKPYCMDLLIQNPSVDFCIPSIDNWNKKYDLVVELRGTWKSLWKSMRYMPKYRLDRGTVRMRNKGKQLHELETNFEIIKPILKKNDLDLNSFRDIYLSEKDKEKAKLFLNENGISKDYCIIHASARKELRRWKPENFSTIADYITEKYHITCIFTGIEEELNQIELIISKMKSKNRAFVFCKPGSLRTLCALMQDAKFFLGNESGPLQLADACKLPSISLFGPGVPNVFYPKNPTSIILHKVLDCNPCDQIHCQFPDNPCIQRISIVEVELAVNELCNPN